MSKRSIVVADTGPINYLLLIGQVELLPRLFGAVHIPAVVRDELCDIDAPTPVREWVSKPPAWLSIKSTPHASFPSSKLDAGEAAALALAVALEANLVLIDDRAGVKAALSLGLEAVGTLGVLDRAASANMVDLRAALSRLVETNFHVRPELIEALLSGHENRN